MIFTQIPLKPRGTDPMGSGDYKSTRGQNRQHRGIDLVAEPGWPILAPVGGTVTKLGYPYGISEAENKTGFDIVFRYVQITDAHGMDHRFFYVEPAVKAEDVVYANEVIGHAQNIGLRRSMDGRTYKARGMKNHIHVEIRDREGDYLNPESVYRG